MYNIFKYVKIDKRNTVGAMSWAKEHTEENVLNTNRSTNRVLVQLFGTTKNSHFPRRMHTRKESIL